MKKPILSVFMITVIALALLSFSNSISASTEPDEISTQELKKLLDAGQDCILVNVLPKIMHDARHIKGSINIPIGQLATTSDLPPDKGKLIIFYCMGPQ